MFYRMSRLHFDDDRFADLLAWAQTVQRQVQDIQGLVFAGIVRTRAGEGRIVAAYEAETDFEAASEVVADLFEGAATYLNDHPHTHAGSSAFSFLD